MGLQGMGLCSLKIMAAKQSGQMARAQATLGPRPRVGAWGGLGLQVGRLRPSAPQKALHFSNGRKRTQREGVGRGSDSKMETVQCCMLETQGTGLLGCAQDKHSGCVIHPASHCPQGREVRGELGLCVGERLGQTRQ